MWQARVSPTTLSPSLIGYAIRRYLWSTDRLYGDIDISGLSFVLTICCQTAVMAVADEWPSERTTRFSPLSVVADKLATLLFAHVEAT